MPLHPDCAAYLGKSTEWMAANHVPPFWEMPHARARQTYRDLILDSQPPLAPMERTEDRTIPTRSGPRRVRVFRPAGLPDGAPVMLYLHSGGYVIGGIEESEQEARRFAAEIPALVISASYRLAPEHKAPAAAEDAWDALTWTAAHAAEFGTDPGRLIVAGCSAGGGLAAVLARRSAQARHPKVALAVLLCPWLDLTLGEPSIGQFARGYDLDREFLDWFVEAYAGVDRTGMSGDPLVSPLCHQVPPGHPSTIILAAECDPLVDEAKRYADRLRHAGIATELIEAAGMIHAFNEITHLIPAGDRPLRTLRAAIRKHIGQQ